MTTIGVPKPRIESVPCFATRGLVCAGPFFSTQPDSAMASRIAGPDRGIVRPLAGSAYDCLVARSAAHYGARRHPIPVSTRLKRRCALRDSFVKALIT